MPDWRQKGCRQAILGVTEKIGVVEGRKFFIRGRVS